MTQLITPIGWAQQTGGETKFEMSDDTIQSLLITFAQQHPAVKPRLLDENGRLKRYFKIFLDQTIVPYNEFAEIRTEPGSVVLILPPMAGG
jgi:sulfur-carrier protein